MRKHVGVLAERKFRVAVPHTPHHPPPPSLTDPPKTGLHTGVWEGVGLGGAGVLYGPGCRISLWNSYSQTAARLVLSRGLGIEVWREQSV